MSHVQCDQIARLFFNIWAIYKIDPIAKFVAKVVSKYYHFAQTLLKFCQSGEISPNLATLNICLCILSTQRYERLKSSTLTYFWCKNLKLQKAKYKFSAQICVKMSKQFCAKKLTSLFTLFVGLNKKILLQGDWN